MELISAVLRVTRKQRRQKSRSRTGGDHDQLVEFLRSPIHPRETGEADHGLTNSDLETAIAKLKADQATFIAAVTASLAALKAQIAAGSPVTEVQLEKLIADVTDADAAVTSAPIS